MNFSEIRASPNVLFHFFTDFECWRRFGVACKPSLLGFSTTASLLQSLPQLLVLRGKGPRRVLTLLRDAASEFMGRHTTSFSGVRGGSTDERKGRVVVDRLPGAPARRRCLGLSGGFSLFSGFLRRPPPLQPASLATGSTMKITTESEF